MQRKYSEYEDYVKSILLIHGAHASDRYVILPRILCTTLHVVFLWYFIRSFVLSILHFFHFSICLSIVTRYTHYYIHSISYTWCLITKVLVFHFCVSNYDVPIVYLSCLLHFCGNFFMCLCDVNILFFTLYLILICSCHNSKSIIIRK